jgi:hypothetical protein
MPLGSNKLGFVKNTQYGVGGTGIPVDDAVIIDISFSGNTTHANSASFTNNFSVLDATTVTYDINTSFVNTTMDYEFTGVTSGDFSNATLSGSITTDANGNASFVKTVTTTGGHKTIGLNLTRPGSSVLIKSANTVFLYEVTPISVTGGVEEATGNIVVESDSDDSRYNNEDMNKGYLLANKRHAFTTGGNTTVTISNYGNYDGNANVWANQYYVNSNATGNVFATGQDNYWDQGLCFKAVIIGSGGRVSSGGGGAGAGEVGVLRYPLGNVATGTYDIQIGSRSTTGNTIIFKGNATLARQAMGGGDGAQNAAGGGFNGGNGGGQGNSSISPGVASISVSPYETDLAQNVANVAFPGNFKEHVVWASGNDGRGTDGGSAFTYKTNTTGQTNDYGVRVDDNALSGFPFIRNWNNGLGLSGSESTLQSTDFRFFHANSPLADGGHGGTQVGVGSPRQGTYIPGSFTPGPGSGYPNGSGFVQTGDGQDGGVYLTYPYRPAYRFVTSQDLS